MGIFDTAKRLFNYSTPTGFDEELTISSPWSTGTGLSAVLGMENVTDGAVSIREALAVPPVTRTIGQYSAVTGPLRMVSDDGQTVPAWINSTQGAITPGGRLVSIVQDLIFHGSSLLWCQREAGIITGALRLPHDLWGIDPMGNITIGGQAMPDQSQFIFIPSYLPMGFLEYAADTIRHYQDLSRTLRARGKNPIPLVDLHVSEAFDGEEEELVKARDDWAAARANENGAVAISPAGIEVNALSPGSNDSEMLTAARNGVRLDIANFMNVDAAIVDGNSGRSMDYANTLQTGSEFVRMSLPLWLNAIEQRLSQPDVANMPMHYDLSNLDTTPAKGNIGTATTEGINP